MNFGQVMDFIVDRGAKDLPCEEFGILFDRLIWATADNGAEICKVRDEWLRGEDERKIEIALSMENTFPFFSVDEMDRVFSGISARFPRFESRCSEISEMRKSQLGIKGA